MSVEITILRNEQAIPVSVDIVRHYKGTNDTDNPTEVDADEVGYDQDGKEYALTADEQGDASSTFLTNLTVSQYQPYYDER